MIKVTFTFLLLSSFLYVSATENKDWNISQSSKNNNYQVDLKCDESPNLNGFQTCNFTLLDKSKNFSKAKVIIDGGMPAHHHGLPTAPLAVWNNNDKLYNINGLKFSMPGSWQLKFLIDKTSKLPRDIVIIDFEIN